MIGLVTDSNAQLPEALRARFGVQIVPLTIVLDGQEYTEGVDLDAGEFYERLAGGAHVSTAAPSPGQVLEAWQAASANGATEILSVHIGSNTSATVNAANLAVPMSDVPVMVVDTGTASFPVACCAWAAATVVEGGGTLGSAADAARAVAGVVDNVFIVGALDLAKRGGRLAAGADLGDGLPVLALREGSMDVVERVHDREAAVDAMARYAVAHAGDRRQRVGVGHAGAHDIADDLAAALGARPEVAEVVRYDISPSVGAHTGLGTAGCVFFPDELAG